MLILQGLHSEVTPKGVKHVLHFGVPGGGPGIAVVVNKKSYDGVTYAMRLGQEQMARRQQEQQQQADSDSDGHVARFSAQDLN